MAIVGYGAKGYALLGPSREFEPVWITMLGICFSVWTK